MNRRDAHLDAMLRHLGAAYYDSLHGRAARADVARALDSVAGQLGEESPSTRRPPPPRPPDTTIPAPSTTSTMGGGTAGCGMS